MIIDLILDRKDGVEYNPHEFYNKVRKYESYNMSSLPDNTISIAMDYGTNEDVKKVLCEYIIEGGYNPKICDYINSQQWIKNWFYGVY